MIFIGDMRLIAEAIPTPRHKRSVDMGMLAKDRMNQMNNLHKMNQSHYQNYQRMLSLVNRIHSPLPILLIINFS